MALKLRAVLEHSLPGRARLRFSSGRGNPALLTTLVAQISESPLVLHARANPRTGSLLVEYQGELDQLIAFAREHELFEVEPKPLSRRPRPRRRAKLRPAMMMATTFAAVALYQIRQGEIFGNALESFWHAYHVRTSLKRPWLAPAFAAIGLYQLARGRIAGPAASLLFYAASAGNGGDGAGDNGGDA